MRLSMKYLVTAVVLMLAALANAAIWSSETFASMVIGGSLIVIALVIWQLLEDV